MFETIDVESSYSKKVKQHRAAKEAVIESAGRLARGETDSFEVIKTKVMSMQNEQQVPPEIRDRCDELLADLDQLEEERQELDRRTEKLKTGPVAVDEKTVIKISGLLLEENAKKISDVYDKMNREIVLPYYGHNTKNRLSN